MIENDLSSIRCLLVEDEEFQQEIATIVLKQAGISNVSIAKDGLSAVMVLDNAATNDTPFDLIVSDLGLPNMDGVEFIRHLAENDIKSAIIIISSMDKKILDTVELVAKSHDLNVLGTIEKPLNPVAVSHMLKNLNKLSATTKKAEELDITAAELKDAIEQNHIEAFFQPKFFLNTKKVAGMEALARWRDPERGLISPGLFIPMAEANGMISSLTEKILDCSICAAAPLISTRLTPSVSINISVDLLDSLSFPDYVFKLTQKYGVKPQNVILEVTESRGISNLSKALDTLVRLRLKGFNLSLDDYGTGSSTLEQLSRIPFSELKIDQSFVTGAMNKKSKRIILESTVNLGRNLGLSIVAEGIESDEDWELVSSMGCDEGQGFHMCRPIPISELVPFLAGSAT